ncbi:FAD binding domain-containing protein [Apiospora saccharicola]
MGHSPMPSLLRYMVNYLLLGSLRTVFGLDLDSLVPLLSPASTVEGRGSTPPRWSDFRAPIAGGVVHPATEEDVQKTLKWAVDRNVPFLVENGANGWATTLHLKEDGIVIALDLLRFVTFSADNRLVTVGGGALTSDVTNAGYSAGALVATGTCNCVGFLGAALGGGIGYLTGEYGLGVDSFVSLNIVRADGTSETLTKTSGELFWALRGAAPNFAIVTSAVILAHPVTNENPATAWTGALVFYSTQIDQVLKAIANLRLDPRSALSMTWVSSKGTPRIIVTVFYHGTEEAGRALFAPLFSQGPVSDSTATRLYTAWNAGGDNACVKGGYKPTWGVGLAKLEPSSWRAVYDVWVDLTRETGTANSSVLLTVYPMERSRRLPPDSAAYPFRNDINYFASFTASFSDLSLEHTALTHGRKARELWQATDGLTRHSTYINNAFGDESLVTVYGDHLEFLRELKRKYDPHGRFDQWFPLNRK